MSVCFWSNSLTRNLRKKRLVVLVKLIEEILLVVLVKSIEEILLVVLVRWAKISSEFYQKSRRAEFLGEFLIFGEFLLIFTKILGEFSFVCSCGHSSKNSIPSLTLGLLFFDECPDSLGFL